MIGERWAAAGGLPDEASQDTVCKSNASFSRSVPSYYVVCLEK